MLDRTETAPEFRLPGVRHDADGIEQYSLADALDSGDAVLLVCYPFDFSPVCTTELCALSDAEWFQFTEGLRVWGVSHDSVYAHAAFVDAYDLTFPLLSDADGEVAEAFDVLHEELEGHERVPQRSVFLIDSDRRIEYAWTTEDPSRTPDTSPITEAVERLDGRAAGVEVDVDSFGVDYAETTPEPENAPGILDGDD